MKKLSLLLIAFVCLFGYTNAQWTPVSGMDGGDVRVFAKNSSYLFAGSQYGGVFRSDDNGNTWDAAFQGLPAGVTISRILATDSVIFAGTGYWSNNPTGIYRSFDNGSSWEIINNGISYTTTPYEDLWITGITFCESTLFVSTRTNGIYRSDNLGDSWTYASPDTLVETYTFSDICAIGRTLFAATQGGNGLYTSTDFGLTWNLGNSGIPLDFYIVDFQVSGTNLYAKTSHGIYWSPAMGDYWVPKNSGISDATDVLNGGFSVSGTTLYTSTSDFYEGPKTYKSTNGGNSWIEIPSMIAYTVSAFLIDGSNVFAGHIGNTSLSANGGGIVRSTDAGVSWAPAVTGLSGIGCTSFTSNSTHIFAGSLYYSGIFNSNDGGVNWDKTYLPDATSNSQILSMLSNGATLFAGVNSTNGIFISSDNGATWASTTSIGYPVYALGANASYVFAGTSNQGMRRTNDNGATWTTINTNLTNTQRKTIRAIAIDGSKIYIGTSQGIFKSTDNGTTWIAANGGTGSPGYGQVKAIVAKGDTLFAGRGSIARSFNGGATWTYVAIGQNFTGVYSLVLIGETLYAGADPYYYGPTSTPLYEGGVFYSTDWGTTWTNMNSTFPMAPKVISLYSYNNKLFAGTQSNGAWYYDLSPTSKTLALNNIFLEGLYDGSATMRQANDESGIHFSAPTADQITVELHDAADYASIVYTASDVDLSISGTATVTVPTTNSGSYYITVKHRNSIETTTAAPVSFAGSTISQSFASPADVYGGNLGLTMDGYYVIYTGDVNQDMNIDSGDFVGIDNDASNYMTGYLVTDVNGDGSIDSGDFVPVDNNASNYIGSVLP